MGYNISIKSRKENLNMGNKVDCHIRIKEAMELRNLNQSDIEFEEDEEIKQLVNNIILYYIIKE